MTEFEKMVSGAWYDPGDEALSAARNLASALCRQANALEPDQWEGRMALLRPLFARTGAEFFLTPDFRCDYGSNLTLGEDFYSNYDLVILDCAPVTFGDRVMVGPNCAFYTAIHPMDAARRATGIERAEPIAVGNDVWFGGNVVVLPGVTIGDGAVIGAGSVVTRDVPAGMFAAGNPCRPIRPAEDRPGP